MARVALRGSETTKRRDGRLRSDVGAGLLRTVAERDGRLPLLVSHVQPPPLQVIQRPLPHLVGTHGRSLGPARLSALYQELRSPIFPESDQASTEPRVDRVSDDERTAGLLEAQAALAAHGGRVAVGWLPFKADIDGMGGVDRPSGPWMRAFAERTGAPIVDVRGCCSGDGLVLADDPGHLSAEGNRAAGLAIAEVLAPLLEGG